MCTWSLIRALRRCILSLLATPVRPILAEEESLVPTFNQKPIQYLEETVVRFIHWNGFSPSELRSLPLARSGVRIRQTISTSRTPRFARRCEKSAMGWGGFEPRKTAVSSRETAVFLHRKTSPNRGEVLLNADSCAFRSRFLPARFAARAGLPTTCEGAGRKNLRPRTALLLASGHRLESMSVTISEAVESYLTDRQSELSDSSLQNHHYQLDQFLKWAGGAGELDHVGDIDPIDVSRFRRARSDDINTNTMYNQLTVLRLFLRFCHRMGWVEESLPESIVTPTRNGKARDSSIDPDRLASILDDLERFEYASLDHVILSLLWTASLRIGGLRAIDVGDVNLDDQFIGMQHRPESNTPLKNKQGSEREVNLHGWVCDVLRAWIDDRRPECIDSHGREPLVTTGRDRLHTSSVRVRVYKLTACGGLGEGCVCSDSASKCDDSVSPHDIRRSSISAWLGDGTEPELLSGRVDTSTSTMSEHYAIRTLTERRQTRRDAFDM